MKTVKKKVWDQVTDQIWIWVNCRVRDQLSYQIKNATRYSVGDQVGVAVKGWVRVQVRHKVENDTS
jgi:hypothetical protein